MTRSEITSAAPALALLLSLEGAEGIAIYPGAPVQLTLFRRGGSLQFTGDSLAAAAAQAVHATRERKPEVEP